jgi:ribonuclease-3
MPLPLKELQERIGYRFRDESILERAMTHSSYSNETGARNHHLLCNERLEFFGDSVLSVITSDYLYRVYPELPEGDLTRVRAATVCEEALASFATELGLGDFLLLGKGESQSGGARKPAVIADAFEAMLAAICLDAGGIAGIPTVAEILLPLIERKVASIPSTAASRSDCKSLLQEIIQRDGPHHLEYRVVAEDGPDHNKTFSVEVYMDSNCIGRGSGHSKRSAEQAAANDALGLFGVKR